MSHNKKIKSKKILSEVEPSVPSGSDWLQVGWQVSTNVKNDGATVANNYISA